MTTENELLPKPTEVKVVEFAHIKACFEYVGAAEMVEDLEKLVAQFPKLAGVGLALATTKASLADQRTRMLTKNIRVAMQAGMDLDNSALTMQVRKDGIYLLTQEHEVEV